jgi:urease subunit alpha
MFGVKPELIIKGGFIAAAKMGDPNASIPTPQPVIYRPMFGAYGKALTDTALTFVSSVALELGIQERYGLKKKLVAVSNCRNISKKDLIHNDKTPEIEVNPENYEVKVDGKVISCEPATEVPMAQRYFLF